MYKVSTKYSHIFLIIFCTLWLSIVVYQYATEHSSYLLAFRHFKYFGLMIFWAIVFVPLSLFLSGRIFSNKGRFRRINGLTVGALFLVVLVSIAFALNQYLKINLDSSHYLHLIGRSSYTLLGLLAILLSATAAGRVVFSRWIKDWNISPTLLFLIYNALGFLIFSLIMFVLGYFNMLISWPLIIMLIVFPGIDYKHSIDSMIKLFWKPFDLDKDWNLLGYLALCLILIIAALNFMYTQAPHPLGFDSRNLYVYLSKVISNSGSLPSGHQPYTWSLIQSLGYIVFKSPEVTLGLSSTGIYMSMLGLYAIGRQLDADKNLLIVACVILALIPVVNNQTTIELKIDLVLMYVQLCVIGVLLHYANRTNGKMSNTLSGDIKIFVILALLIGLSLSIKILGFFLLFGVLVALWWILHGLPGSLSVTSIGLGLMFLLKVDDLSLLRNFHYNPNIIGVIFILLGTLGLVFILTKKKTLLISSIVKSISIIVLSVVVLSPWLIKNYSDSTGVLTMEKILLGDKGDFRGHYDIIEAYNRAMQEKEVRKEQQIQGDE